jgi:hypothetical protein
MRPWPPLALALVLAGCMTITPDPELPDVVAEWTVSEVCTDGVVAVRVEVTDDDAAVPPVAQEFACTDGIGRVEDVARTQHVVQAALLDASGAIIARSEPFPVDMRDGASRRQQLWWFYYDEGLFTLAWRFTGGETCASLGLTSLQINAVPDDPMLGRSGFGAICERGELDYYPGLLAGTYELQIVGISDNSGVVTAASMRLPGLVIRDRGELVDLGTIDVSRCPPCDLQDQPPPPPPPP